VAFNPGCTEAQLDAFQDKLGEHATLRGMATTPERRLERHSRHARRGLQRARRDDSARRRAFDWIIAHPSRLPEADALWLAALNGEGPLIKWLEGGDWRVETLSLRSVVACHPFPDLPQWSTQKTSNRS
jgi:hypothetical protein